MIGDATTDAATTGAPRTDGGIEDRREADPRTDGGGAEPGTDDAGRPSWPAVGVVLAVLWLFVNGVPLSPGLLAGQFLVGLVLGLPVAYASRRFYWPETDPVRLVRAAPYVTLYVLTFLRVLLVANLDVAYRVLAPSMPIEPAVIEFPLRVRTDVAITTIANSITLTPGTLTMDHDADRNVLYVHAIDGRDPEAVVRPIRRWEEYALAIFDEELKPGDPVPAPAAGDVSAGRDPTGHGRPADGGGGDGDDLPGGGASGD